MAGGVARARFGAGNRRRRLQLGLDGRLCERALEVLPVVLAGGPLSRAELARGLAAKGGQDRPARAGAGPPGRPWGHAGPGLPGSDLDGDEASHVLLEDWVVRPRPRPGQTGLGAGRRWLDPPRGARRRAGVGTWRARRMAGRLDLTVEPFGDGLPDRCGPALEEEMADLGRYLGVTVRLAALGGR